MTDLSTHYSPYSKDVQIAAKPKPTTKDTGKDGYLEATQRATDSHGKICCEDCGRVIPKGQDERHHVKKRSQGGGNEAKNILVLGKPCHRHREEHGGKIMPSIQRDKLKGQCKD